MKKITYLLIFIASCFSANAQFSCAGAVPMTNGFSQMNITTPGLGAGSPGAWVSSFSSQCLTTTGGSYYYNVFTSAGDDYVFSYTTGNVAGESVSFQFTTNSNYQGACIFRGCNGGAMTDCLAFKYNANPATSTITAANLGANETIYVAVGIWSTPNDLNFSVNNFTVTPSLGVVENNIKSISVYPNPVKDFLQISNAQQNISDVVVYNLLGQQVIRENWSGKNNSSLDMTQLISGTYLVKIIADGKTESKRIIKE
ncbi:MAG TPA: T9SS type A sorting domain-containing protein [Flavobacterium sp.]|uniref:T9SS type A sorting domain-containing protein n=1 Tax=Flavobacterium sp. TaxID=239 RepID=UPI002ED4886C